MTNGKAEATASVWIVPVWQLCAALAVLVGLVLFWWLMRRRRAGVINRAVAQRLNEGEHGAGPYKPEHGAELQDVVASGGIATSNADSNRMGETK